MDPTCFTSTSKVNLIKWWPWYSFDSHPSAPSNKMLRLPNICRPGSKFVVNLWHPVDFRLQAANQSNLDIFSILAGLGMCQQGLLTFIIYNPVVTGKSLISVCGVCNSCNPAIPVGQFRKWGLTNLQWIRLRENLQETIDFPIKYGAFL